MKSVIPSPKTPLLPNLEQVYPMPLSIFFILTCVALVLAVALSIAVMAAGSRKAR